MCSPHPHQIYYWLVLELIAQFPISSSPDDSYPASWRKAYLTFPPLFLDYFFYDKNTPVLNFPQCLSFRLKELFFSVNENIHLTNQSLFQASVCDNGFRSLFCGCLWWVLRIEGKRNNYIYIYIFFFLNFREVPPLLGRREWQPTSVLLPGKSHGERSLAGYSPWGHKDSDKTEVTNTRSFM